MFKKLVLSVLCLSATTALLSSVVSASTGAQPMGDEDGCCCKVCEPIGSDNCTYTRMTIGACKLLGTAVDDSKCD